MSGLANSSPSSARPALAEADLSPERWQRIKEVFAEAQQRGAAERGPFLQKVCGADEPLRREVESLLAAAEAAENDTIESSASSDPSSRTDEAMIGRRIGSYKIIRRIGRGGMATVYLASRADEQYEKQVAIKILLPELDSDDLLLRFRNERQTLAKLDHPNIVKLLDGGSTDEGLPYLVMDYVEGTPIDEYCDNHKLSTDERLHLFCQVCAAVQCAHQNLVIHRDLKPSNVLVTKEGIPKLLDFGISKVLHPNSKALLTHTLTRRMTPAYASPEQVRGESVTPATDIYSLGVVLYELLTGHRPYRLKQYTPGEVERAICDQEPEKPSTAVNRLETVNGPDRTTISKTPETVSALRESEPGKLHRRLSGDLDNIVLMALQKESQRRYLSVEEISRDIQRHLQNLPVAARRSTLRYRTWKFLRRHSTGAIAATVIVVIILAAIGSVVWEQHHAIEKARAELARQRSSGRRSVAVLGFKNLSGRSDTTWLSTALEELLTTELSAGGKLRTIPTESVAQARLNLSLPAEDSLSPGTLSRVYKNLGSDFVVIGSYLDIGNISKDVRLDLHVQDAALGETVVSLTETGTETALPDLVIRAGADLRRTFGVSGLSATEAAGAQASLPVNVEATRLYAEGMAKLRVYDAMGARAFLEKSVAADPNYAMAHSALADSWSTLGYDAKARQEAKNAFDLAGTLPREQSLWIEGRYYQATRKWDQAIDIYHTLFNFFPDNLDYGLGLAAVQIGGGKGSDALNTILALRKLSPPSDSDPRIDLAEANAAAAVSNFRQELSAAGKAVSKGELSGARLLVAQARVAEGQAFRNLGDPQKANAASYEGRRLFAAAGNPVGEARVLRTIASVFLDRGDLDSANKTFREALEIHRRIGNKAGEAAVLSAMAGVLSAQKQTVEAREALQNSLVLSRELGDEPAIGVTLRNLGNLDFSIGDSVNAKTHYREGLARAKKFGNQSEVARNFGELAKVFWAEGDLQTAKRMREESLAIHRRLGEKNSIAGAVMNLAMIQLSLGDLQKAEKLFVEAQQLFSGTGNQRGIAYAVFCLGKIREDQYDFAAARRYFEKALDLRQKSGDQGYLTDTRLALGEMAIDEGRPSETEIAARKAIEEYHAQEDLDNEVGAKTILIQSLLAQNRISEAEQISASSVSTFNSTNNIIRLTLTTADASVRAASGKAPEAVKILKENVRDANKTGYLGLQFDARLALGEAEMKAGKLAEGRAELASLERDAKAKGFLLIAHKAANVRVQP